MLIYRLKRIRQKWERLCLELYQKKIKIRKIKSQQQENGGHFNNGENLTVNFVLELGQMEKRVFITKND